MECYLNLVEREMITRGVLINLLKPEVPRHRSSYGDSAAELGGWNGFKRVTSPSVR
jgi:hypothetical protein